MPKISQGAKLENFTVNTVNAKNTSLSALVDRRGKTAIVFLRYYGCPLCQYDLIKYSENYAEISAGGNAIVAVLQSTPESIASQTDLAFPFEIICDPDMLLYKELEIGLMAPPADGSEPPAPTAEMMQLFKTIEDMGISHGPDEGIEEQLPAWFIVDSQLNVTAAHYCATPFDLPTAQDLAKLFA